MKFADVKIEELGYEAVEAIQFVDSMGIMHDYGNGTFDPKGELTNAEFCRQVAWLFLDMPSLIQASYATASGVDVNHWAHKYAEWMLARLTEMNSGLWFSAENVHDPLSSGSARKILDLFFKTIIVDFEIGSASDKASDAAATRLEIATEIHTRCKKFISQIQNRKTDAELYDLFRFWVAAPVDPYALAMRMMMTEEQDPSQLKVGTLSYKLMLLAGMEKTKTLETFQAFDRIDELHEKFNRCFPQYIGSAYHYTSLSALYSMLEKSNMSPPGLPPKIKLFLSNVEYLNDPAEGSYFRPAIEKDRIPESGGPGKAQLISPRQIYIASLTKDETERLPLWVQYGDNGAGCRIEFYVESVHDFREVKYMKPEDAFPPEQESAERDLVQYIKNAENSAISQYAYETMNVLAYLIKNPYYEHEHEIRHSRKSTPMAAMVFDDPRPGEAFPRLYCELFPPITIKSVTLGPKCPNPQTMALYLQRKGVSEIRKSSIEFR